MLLKCCRQKTCEKVRHAYISSSSLIVLSCLKSSECKMIWTLYLCPSKSCKTVEFSEDQIRVMQPQIPGLIVLAESRSLI